MKSFWEHKGIEYEEKPASWYTSNDELAIEYRDYVLEQCKKVNEEMDTPGICSSCIHLFDESSLTCCIKNNRWVTVEYSQKCDIGMWEGFSP